jgi:hypothetical protein
VEVHAFYPSTWEFEAGKLNDVRKTDYEIRSISHSVQKIKPKWTKILNVRPKTLKLQKENIGETLEDLGFSE